MRSGLVLFGLLLMTNAFALESKSLTCNDQNSHAVYSLKLSNSKLEILPLIKDSSVLSASEAVLNFEEGESTESLQLFSGKNKDRKTIVAQLSVDQVMKIKKNQIVEIELLFAKESKNLDQKTTFLCSLN
jgi:hypothetical protein